MLSAEKTTGFKPVQFGKYILLDKIATGGMAELYRAKITGVRGFEKLIAIKTILPHLSTEASLVESFIDEAKLAAYLQHPNIVQIYDFGKMEGTYFLAMEYFFGKDLKSVLEKSTITNIPLALEDALHITARVCDGLHYAHNLNDFRGDSLNIIHRDIGPQNIFITYDGQVKIIDFGIAKAAIQNTSTQSDLIKGKVAYMSPEQAQGKKIDHRSDIFSIGILLYELVTNQRMFVGDNIQIYDKVCKAEFEAPENTGRDLPSSLCKILNKALAKKPDQRYQSADEMASELNEFINQLSFFPTDKTLAQYIKGLFEKEAEDEEHAMRQAVLYDQSKDPEFSVKQETGMLKTATIATKNLYLKSGWKKPLYAAIILLFISVGAWILFTAMEKPLEIRNRFKQDGSQNQVLASSDSDAQNGFVQSSESNDPNQPGIGTGGADSAAFDRGRKLIEGGRFEEAVLLFEDILSKNPSIHEKLSPFYSEALHGLADQFVEKQPEKTKELLQKSVEINPKDSQGYFLLGRLYTSEKNYEKAISSYKKAIDLDTDIHGAFYNLGYIYYAVKKDYLRAEEMYARTVRLSPPFLDEALFNLALTQRKLGKNEECINNLRKAISANPNNKPAKGLLARLTHNT